MQINADCRKGAPAGVICGKRRFFSTGALGHRPGHEHRFYVEGNAYMAQPSVDLSLLEPILAEYADQKGALIPILQHAQDEYGYLPVEVLTTISKRTGTPLSKIYGVATFYAQFYLHPRGRHIVRVCDGTACHVKGAAKIIDELGNTLKIIPSQTTDDFRVTFEVVYCLGSCGLAPVAVVDERVVGRLTPAQMVKQVQVLA